MNSIDCKATGGRFILIPSSGFQVIISDFRNQKCCFDEQSTWPTVGSNWWTFFTLSCKTKKTADKICAPKSNLKLKKSCAVTCTLKIIRTHVQSYYLLRVIDLPLYLIFVSYYLAISWQIKRENINYANLWPVQSLRGTRNYCSAIPENILISFLFS